MEILLDTYCKNALCQHPACWEAHRRESRGLLCVAPSVPKRTLEYNALPTQQVINLFEELDDFSSNFASQPVLLTEISNSRSSNRISSRFLVTPEKKQGNGRSGERVTEHREGEKMTEYREELHANDESNQIRQHLPSVVRQVEIHELFDKRDLRSKWHETFAPKSYYVWVPATHSRAHSDKLKTHHAAMNRSGMVVKDLTEGLLADGIHRTSPSTRSRTRLRSPRFIRDRLRENTRPFTCPASDGTLPTATKISSSMSDRRLCHSDIYNSSEEFILCGYNKQLITEGTIQDTEKDFEVTAGAKLLYAECDEIKREKVSKDLKSRSVARQQFVNRKTNEEMLPRSMSRSVRQRVSEPRYVASPMSSIRIPQVPVATPASPTSQHRVITSRQTTYKTAGLHSDVPLSLNVETEIKLHSPITSQHKMPSVTTLPFSPAQPFHDKQFTPNKRCIDVSVSPTNAVSKIHNQPQQSEKEDTIVREPSPPPPSPDNQIHHSFNEDTEARRHDIPDVQRPPSADNQIHHTSNGDTQLKRHDIPAATGPDNNNNKDYL